MIPFKLVIKLATPVVMRNLTTLDALLSAAVFNKTGLMAQATEPFIPLLKERGIYRGSSLVLHAQYHHTKVMQLQSLRGESDLSTHAFSPNYHKRKYTRVVQATGPFKTSISLYPAYAAKEVYFFGVGDPDAVVELIQNHIQGIGKRNSVGAGEIQSVLWEDSEDYSWINEKGMPARPLPLALWQEIGGNPSAPVAPLSVSLPYWQTEKVQAVFPVI